MGRFDELRINKKWLPVELKSYEKGWQTKDLECEGLSYSINEIGQLVLDNVPIPFEGELNFYHDVNGKWHEFDAIFVYGIVQKIIPYG